MTRKYANLIIGSTLSILFLGGLLLVCRDSIACIIRGKSVIVAKPRIRVQTIPTESTYELIFDIENIVSKPLKILGCTSTCGCTTLETLPKIIGPRSSGNLVVLTKPNGDKAPITSELYTDRSELPRINLEIEFQ